MTAIKETPGEDFLQLCLLLPPLGKLLHVVSEEKVSQKIPPKKSQQQQSEVGDGTTGGAVEDGFLSGINPGMSVESNLASLAKMFEGFRAPSDREGQKAGRRSCKAGTKVQCAYSPTYSTSARSSDLEAARTGQLSDRAPKEETNLQRLEDSDDTEHFYYHF